ncbi:MAG: hypothetical protein HQK51_07845, partial [Oligoflexia bacterium]|nr:hypothetical protein [Oligoflexia bacterium]
MLILLEVLKRFWPYITITALLVVVGYFKLTNDKLQTNVDKAIAQNAALASSFDTLKVKTEQCNLEVEKLNRDGIALNEKLKIASTTISGLKIENDKRIMEIRNAKVPNECPQAINY